jgi:hypothetical protein
MKRIFDYLNDNLAAVLSISLAVMFSSSVFALMEGFNHLV